MTISAPAWTLGIARQIKDAGGTPDHEVAFISHLMRTHGPGPYQAEYEDVLVVWIEERTEDNYDAVVNVRNKIDDHWKEKLAKDEKVVDAEARRTDT